MNHDLLFADIQKILERKKPRIAVFGIVNRVTTLSPEETEQFITEQIKEIGHGHDPAKEYVDQSLLDGFMKKLEYEVIDRERIIQPLKGFDPSPWEETITVYRKV